MTHPWGRSSWSGATYSGTGASGGYQVPGFPDVYYWSSRTGGGGWAVTAYGGANVYEKPSGGLLATADADSGTVALMAWWASASSLSINRVDSSGTRIPVRGLAPFVTTGNRTRINSATNPVVRDTPTGYTATTGTLSRLTNLAEPLFQATTAARVTATSGGAATVRFDKDVVPTYPTTLGCWIRTSALASSIALSVAWYDLASNLLVTTTVSPASIAVSQAVGHFSWCEFVVTAPNPSAQVGQASIVATGLGNGGTIDITGRLWEDGVGPLGDYFDGDSLGGSWRGTDGESSSRLAPIQYLLDGEAPLDEPVTYELSNPSQPGFAATTTTVTLSSRGNRTWLSHPSQPWQPIRVEVLGPFGPVTRAIVQGEYYPLDSVDGLPIVKTQARRRGRKGAIKFLSISHGERDRLLGLFDDGSPVLVRSPKTYGHGSMWLSLGDLTEDQAAYWSESPFRTLSADYTEVAAPLTANEV